MHNNTRYDVMLAAFSAAMKTQMLAHDERGGGSRGNIARNEPVPRELFAELTENMQKLDNIVWYGESPTGEQEASLVEHRISILNACADVANMAMLIALNSAALNMAPPEVCDCGFVSGTDKEHSPECPAR